MREEEDETMKCTYQKEEVKAIHDGSNRQHRFPVFTKDVQAYIAFKIDVGVIDLSQAFYFRGLVRVGIRNSETKEERTTPVVVIAIEKRR
jgi:hypothetical protein